MIKPFGIPFGSDIVEGMERFTRDELDDFGDVFKTLGLPKIGRQKIRNYKLDKEKVPNRTVRDESYEFLYHQCSKTDEYTLIYARHIWRATYGVKMTIEPLLQKALLGCNTVETYPHGKSIKAIVGDVEIILNRWEGKLMLSYQDMEAKQRIKHLTIDDMFGEGGTERALPQEEQEALRNLFIQ